MPSETAADLDLGHHASSSPPSPLPTAPPEPTFDALTEVVTQCQALSAAAHAQVLSALGAIDASGSYRDDGATSMVAWVTERLVVTARHAHELVEVARGLRDLPHLAAAYGEGRVSFDQLVPLVLLARADGDERWATLGPAYSVAQLVRLVAAVVPRDRIERDAVHARRHLRITHRDGATHLRGLLRDDQGLIVEGALVALAEARLAEAAPGVTPVEPFAAALVDALVECASTELADTAYAAQARIICHLDQGVVRGGAGVAEAEGIGAIDWETARRLGCDAIVQGVLDDEAGRPVGVGRATRVVPFWLRRHLLERDVTCRFPGCGRRRLLHAHHLVFWGQGGRSDADNLALVCSFHHHLVHEGGWRLSGDPGVELSFVSPTGRIHRSRPTPLRRDIARRIFATRHGPAG